MSNLAYDPDYNEQKECLKTYMYEKMKSIGDDFDSNLHYRSRWVKNRKILRTATLKR